MTYSPRVSCLLAALLLTPAAVASGAPPQVVGPIPVASADPAIPRATGKPCVVTLFRDQALYAGLATDPGLDFTYAPPPGCSGPWSKIILKLDFSADRYVVTQAATLRLAGRAIFQGGMPDFTAGATWHAERDVTDLGHLLSQPHNGQLFALRGDVGSNGGTPLVGTAQVFFYRASASDPAQAIPDAIYRVGPQPTAIQLPHNIVRAYLDIYNAAPWWFTCVPDADNATWPITTDLAPGDRWKTGFSPPWQGCLGGSFAEIEVGVDGTPAATAPYFPRLSADFNYYFKNTVDLPAPVLQMLNPTPYRVDITPFAAILNEAGSHTITMDGRTPVDAQLVIYQDKRSTRVGGAVTLNTLASSGLSPTLTDTLAESNDLVQGNIVTSLDRQYQITGYVNTSRGRVDTSINQSSRFLNVQAIVLDGLIWPNNRLYSQHLQLTSTTEQHSTRTLKGAVISDDTRSVSYPLIWNYDMAGEVLDTEFGELLYPKSGQVNVSQSQSEDFTLLRPNERYESHIRDTFAGTHVRDIHTGTDGTWQTSVERRFWDNMGSCREAALSTSSGVVSTTTLGAGCPNQTNHVRWFAHPDGSPDGLGWVH